jgi:hypothetical protein
VWGVKFVLCESKYTILCMICTSSQSVGIKFGSWERFGREARRKEGACVCMGDV